MRYQDPGYHVNDLAERCLVVCPTCEGDAETRWYPDEGHARLSCTHCGLARTSDGEVKFSQGPNDPYFSLSLWLQTRCCGEVLWARNGEHLRNLRAFISADLRERPRNTPPGTPRNTLMSSRLPRWMTSGKNRSRVLKSIDDLESRLPGELR